MINLRETKRFTKRAVSGAVRGDPCLKTHTFPVDSAGWKPLAGWEGVHRIVGRGSHQSSEGEEVNRGEYSS